MEHLKIKMKGEQRIASWSMSMEYGRAEEDFKCDTNTLDGNTEILVSLNHTWTGS